MGRRGPPANPTALKIATCNADHDHTSTCFADRRPLNANEPKAAIPEKPPDPPKYLGNAARKKWLEVVPEIHALGLVSNIDPMALELLFDAYGKMLAAGDFIAQNGFSYGTDKGAYCQYPEVAVWRSSADLVRKMLSEFGMTPASRSRIQIKLPEQDGDKEKQRQEAKFYRTNNLRT